MKHGCCGMMTRDYKPRGATSLFAVMSVLNEAVSQYQSHYLYQEWLKLLNLIKASVPCDQPNQQICENYTTQKHPKMQPCAKRSPWCHFHFMPTDPSCLNMLERFIWDLREKILTSGNFTTSKDVIGAITDYVNQHNDHPKPFIWTATANNILVEVKRARATVNKF